MIKLVDLNLQHTLLHEDLNAAFQSVLSRGQFILGQQIQTLEAAFAAYQDCQYAVGVSSGTDALLLALRALGVGPGDEVIVPSMTFCATAEAVWSVGARPVLVDVEPDTWGLDPALTAAAITERTKAIIPVHLHGWPVPLAPFLELAQQHDLVLLEDCAQAHGARESGCAVGSRSAAGCFSFFPGKNLGALGDGGMVTTNDLNLATRIRSLANHGRRDKYLNDEIGYNARLDELQAAFLNVKLRHLNEWNEQRRALALRYNQAFAGLPFKTPPGFDGDRLPVFHLYVIQCDSVHIRDNLAQFLKSNDIQCGIHYPVPLHLQPAFEFLGHTPGSLPVSEHAAQTMLSLPVYPGMTTVQQDIVIEQVTQFITTAVTEAATV